MAEKKSKSRSNPIIALVLAWLVPGAGHVYVGRTLRGIVIFAVISGTFWAGMAMGGVMTVDYHGERWWFVAQMFTGVQGVLGWQHERRLMKEVLSEEDVQMARGHERQMAIDKELAARRVALVSPMATVARAYAGVAGLLNLMCIFDATILSLMGIAGEPPPGGGRREAGKARTP
jgi:TM2 domain-containing membrane protein YozV